MNSDVPTKEKIIEFSKKYIGFFEQEYGSIESKYRFFDTDSFSNDCRALGFEMDCGNAFIAALGENAWSSKGLRLSIDRIEDVNLIGSALYSKWREYNHWSSPSDANDETKEWFLMLLKRMQELSQ